MSQPENGNQRQNNNVNNFNFELNETIPNIKGSMNKNVQRISKDERIKIKNYITQLKLRTSKYISLPEHIRPDSSYKKIIYYISKLNEELEKFKEYKSLNTFNSSEPEKNYIIKIVNFKKTIINSIKYWTIINRLYRDNYKNFNVNEIEDFFRSLSQKYKENVVSFKTELYGNRTNQYPGYLKLYKDAKIDFQNEIKELKIIYEENMKFNITKIVELYIRQVKGFEYFVQDFYKTISDILHKLLDLTRLIASNEEMEQLNLQLINKISIIFKNNSKKPSKNVSLKNLFNKITNGHQTKLKQQKEFINRFSVELKKDNQTITFQHLLKFVNNGKNKEFSKKDIQEFNEIPINDYFSKILTFYNEKLNTRIKEINELLGQYQALCKQFKASIALAQQSKTASSDLINIKRIENQVKAIMEQYTQLNTIGNICKNLGNNIRNLSGNTTNQGNMVVPHKMSSEIPVSRNIKNNSPSLNNLSSFDGGNFKSPRNKAQFIFDYLLNKDGKSNLPHLHGTDNNSALDNDGNIKNKEKLQEIYNKITNVNFQARKEINSVKKGVKMPENSPGYSNNIIFRKRNSNTYNIRILFAKNNKNWLVTYLENKLNNQ